MYGRKASAAWLCFAEHNTGSRRDSQGVQNVAAPRRSGRLPRAASNPIWAELDDVLRAHGVRSYSIFLDPDTNDLFGYAEVESDERWAAIADTEVCRRWWQSVRELMPSNPDDSPESRDLREVFHLRAPRSQR